MPTLANYFVVQNTRLTIKIFCVSSKQCWSSRLVWQTPEPCHEVRACGGYCRNAKYQRLCPSLGDKELCVSLSGNSTSAALFSHGRIASAKVCFLRAVLFVIFQETALPFYKSLQTDLGDLSVAGKCSENSGVQFIPFSAVEISAVDKIEKNVFLVVCLMQTVPLFILWWPHSSSTCPLDGEDYCNSLLERLPAAQLCHLQPVQNAVTHSRPVLSKYDHPSCTSTHLLCLLWSSCLIFKVCSLSFEFLNGLDPGYSRELLHKYHLDRYHHPHSTF